MSKKWRAIFLFLLVGLVGFFCYWKYFENKKHHFSVVFFAVGQGDSALINFSNGQKMLVDCGPNNMVLSKLGRWLPFYDRTIDYLVVSHPDLDHYGGCVDVVRRYNVKNIIENGETKQDDYWQTWEETKKNKAVQSIIVNSEKQFNFGVERINFLFPTNTLQLEGNNRSLVFNLQSNSFRVLFAGDAEYELEKSLITSYPANILRANYLKIGHHGSDSSTSDEWLEVVHPNTAIISVGRNNFGHPSLRVVRKLERNSVDKWRTDQKGDIIIDR